MFFAYTLLENAMKTLTVYLDKSFEKYPRLYDLHTFEILDNGILKVYRSSWGISHEEGEAAVFKNWNYFTIEEETEVSE